MLQVRDKLRNITTQLNSWWIIMYAVVSDRSRQYIMREGGIYKIDRLNAEVGAEVTFNDVLLLSSEDESNAKIDAADLKNNHVIVEVLEHKAGPKVNIIKFKRRKHHMKRMGHRQKLSVIKVKKIS